jgi:tetratricopeptide (TPR) repeat protein
MSRSRQDPHKARLRRDRIRREKHAADGGRAAEAGPPPLPAAPNLPRFASERSLRELHALLEGQEFTSAKEVNARLAELTRGGGLSEKAAAWKRDDPKWRAQELAYDALETNDFEDALRLVNDALKLDPDCTDAQRLMVSLLPMSLENRIHLMKEVVEKAERNFGEEFFRENAGHFWGIVETRPYMRAKLHLAELLVEAGRLEEGAAVYARILELCPGDNLGVRYQLPALYLALRQTERASEFLSRSSDEEEYSAALAWARILERWQAGKLDEAEVALKTARKVNPFLEDYLCGAKKPPEQPPEYFTPGDESEAQAYAGPLSLAVQHNPGFREWLQQRK